MHAGGIPSSGAGLGGGVLGLPIGRGHAGLAVGDEVGERVGVIVHDRLFSGSIGDAEDADFFILEIDFVVLGVHLDGVGFGGVLGVGDQAEGGDSGEDRGGGYGEC